MKPFETTMKVLAALAAVAGVVALLAVYGDKIVAWAKKMMAKLPCRDCDIIEFTPAEDFDEEAENDFVPDAPVEAPAEEAAQQEEVPAEDAAEDADFQA